MRKVISLIIAVLVVSTASAQVKKLFGKSTINFNNFQYLFANVGTDSTLKITKDSVLFYKPTNLGLGSFVSGSGTTDYVAKFTGSNTIGNSALQESGGQFGFNTAIRSGQSVAIPVTNGYVGFDQGLGTSYISWNKTSGGGHIGLIGYVSGVEQGHLTMNYTTGQIEIYGSSAGYYPAFYAMGQEDMRINTNHNALIGTTVDNAVGKLQVEGKLTIGTTATGSGTDSVLTIVGKEVKKIAQSSLGGGTPGGANTQVQFNNSGAFGGNSSFTWDNTNKTLTIQAGAGSPSLVATSTTGVGISGSSTSNSGVFASSGSGNAFYGRVTPAGLGSIVTNSTLDATPASGSTTAGFGQSIDFLTQAAGTASLLSNRIVSTYTSIPTAGTRVSQLEFWGVNGGTSARKMAIAGNGQLTLDGYTSAVSGTAAFNLAVDASGNVITTATSGGSSSSNTTNAKTTITTGTSSTVPASTRRVYIDPASVLSSYTLTLPASPADGDEVLISFGGTIAAGASVVTTLTISPNSGQTIMQFITPGTAKGGDNILYHYNSTNSKWYREL